MSDNHMHLFNSSWVSESDSADTEGLDTVLEKESLIVFSLWSLWPDQKYTSMFVLGLVTSYWNVISMKWKH